MDPLAEFEELDVLEDVGEMARLPRRIVKDRLDFFTCLTDDEFTSRFRIGKITAMSLLGELHLPQANDSRGCPVPPHLQLLITLRLMATGDLQLTIADTFDVSQQFVSSCSSRTVRAIAALLHRYVKFPERHQLQPVKDNFFVISGFPSVIGAIDCTHIPIQSPGGPRAEQYRCRKGFFSFNVQAVCGADLSFFNVVCRWPGSVHDSRIFRNSALYAELQAGGYSGHLLGDSAYPLSSFLLTPVLSPTQQNELRYNFAHSKTRNPIERAFGVLKRRFRCLAIPMRTSLETTMATVCCAAVLHNLELKHRNGLDHDDDDDDDDGDYDNGDGNNEGEQIIFDENVPIRNAGQRKRTNIINSVF